MSRSTTVAFPVVAHPIPDFPPQGQEWTTDEFRQMVARETPHWLFHLRIEPWPLGLVSRSFPVVSDGDLDNLHRQLGLPGDGLLLRPLEFIHGELHRLHNRSPYAFGLPAAFAGRSSLLAVAAGLAAAALERPLPEWVIFSGPLEMPFAPPLALGITGHIQKKMMLLFGRAPGYAVAPVLERLYRTPATVERLGEFAHRVCPDRIRLFITSSKVDAHPLDLDPPLSAEARSCRLTDFGQPDFPALLERVRVEAEGDLLVAQVPTVFHALRLLGYHHVHPLIEQRCRLVNEPVRFYRVRHASPSAQALVFRPEFEAQVERALLETMLIGARDCRRRLQVILDRCLELVHCQSGDIGVLRGEQWLEVFCREHPNGPENGFVPAQLGITGRVVRSGRPEVVASTAQDEDFQKALAAPPEWDEVYGPDVVQQNREFLAHVRACVKLPLVWQNRRLGVLCLHRNAEGPFNPNVVQLLQVHAERAAQEVARYLEEERTVGWRGPLQYGLGSVEALEQRLARMPRAGAQAELGRDLARLAWQLAGASRACVRLITPDRRSLVVAGAAGGPGAWPEEFLSRPLALDNPAPTSAAEQAIRERTSRVIDDTSSPGGAFCPVPPGSQAHAAIVLRASGHIIGVLSVDWDQAGACTPVLRAQLENLAGRFAVVLKAFAVDDLFAELERTLAGTPAGQSPDYPAALKLIARMVGGQQGAIFLHRPDSDRLHLAASLLHSDWAADEVWYDWGEGVTGWVAKHNRPVRIANLADESELNALNPADPPRWKYKHHDGRQRGDLNHTYLGVPLAVGGQVLGVLRLASTDVSSGFSTYDLQVAVAAGSRLAGWHWQHRRAQAATETLHLTEVWLDWLNASPQDQADPARLEALGNALVRVLPAGTAWLWLVSPAHTFVRCLKAWGANQPSIPEPAGAAVLAAVGDEPYQAAVEPAAAELRSLAGAFPEPDRSRLLARPRIAIPLSAGDALVALFFLAPRSSRLEEGHLDLLRRVTGLFRRGRHLLPRRSTPASPGT